MKNKNLDFSQIKKVLIVKLRHLGDVLLAAPVFDILKENIPHAQIDAYLYREGLSILEGNSSISKFLLYDQRWKELPFFKRMGKEIEILRTIKREKYDLVINLTEGDRGAIVCKVSQAQHKIGFDPEGKGFKGKKKVYTHIIKTCGTPRHSVEKNLDALRSIGISPGEDEKKLHFHIPILARKKIQGFLKENGILSKGFILIHPASRWRFKCWPTSKYTKLLDLLLKRGETVVFTAGEERLERQMVEEIVSNYAGRRVFNLAGKITLKELAALIDACKALICVDSVALHIASALMARGVVIFGPTSEIRWGPWKNPHMKVVKQDFSCRPCCQDGCGGSKISECLHTLRVEAVMEKLLQ